MNEQQAKALAKQITDGDYGVHVNSLIERDGGSWALTLTDTKTGVQFVVNSLEEWAERRADASLDWGQYA